MCVPGTEVGIAWNGPPVSVPGLGSQVSSWLAPRPGNLTDRLAQLKEADAVAEELYLSTLTRLPGDDERREVGDYLKGRTADRTAALQELAWALLASAEFRFNH